MRLSISHDTTYRYDDQVRASIQYLRLTPHDSERQQVLSWQLDLPRPVHAQLDPYGNILHVLTLDEPHESIVIGARGQVEIDETCEAEHERQSALPFLRFTRLTQADDAIREFAAQLKAEGLPHDRLAAQARVAMLLSDLPTRWPYAFLDQEHTPGEARVAMEKSALQAGPDLAVSNMVPREIDLGVLPEAAGDTLDTLERWPLIRLLLLWALFAAVMAAVFALTRR